jgi:hypothetical protein
MSSCTSYRCVSEPRSIQYSGRKINESVGNVIVRGEKYGRSKGGARWPTVCLSMYSITENIYYSQLSSDAILLQSEPVSHRTIQGKDCVLSPSVLSSCGLPPPSHVSTSNGQRSSQLFCVRYTNALIFGTQITSWKLITNVQSFLHRC